MTGGLHKKTSKEREITITRNNKNNTKINNKMITRKQKW